MRKGANACFNGLPKCNFPIHRTPLDLAVSATELRSGSRAVLCSFQFGLASAPTIPHPVQTMRGANAGTDAGCVELANQIPDCSVGRHFGARLAGGPLVVDGARLSSDCDPDYTGRSQIGVVNTGRARAQSPLRPPGARVPAGATPPAPKGAPADFSAADRGLFSWRPRRPAHFDDAISAVYVL